MENENINAENEIYIQYTPKQKVQAIYWVISKLKKANDQLGLCYWFQNYFYKKYNHLIMYNNLRYYIPEIFDTKFARKKRTESTQTFWWYGNQKRINYLKGCLNYI